MHDRLSRWWSTISLRSKITGVTVFLLAMGLTVAGAGTLSVVSSYLTDETDRRLQVAVGDLDPYIMLDGSSTFSDDIYSGHNPYYLAAIDADSGLIQDNLTEEDRASAPDVSALSLLYLSEHEGAFTLFNEKHTAQWRVIALPLRVGESGDATLLVGQNLSANNNLLIATRRSSCSSPSR